MLADAAPIELNNNGVLPSQESKESQVSWCY